MNNLHEIIRIAVRARYAFSIWVCGTAILLLPTPLLSVVSITRTTYGAWLAPVSLLAFTVWAVEIVLQLWEASKARSMELKEHHRLRDLLFTLNREEKMILLRGLNSNEQTVTCRIDSHAAVSLVAKKLLVPTVEREWVYNNRPFFIPPTVWKEIKGFREQWNKGNDRPVAHDAK